MSLANWESQEEGMWQQKARRVPDKSNYRTYDFLKGGPEKVDSNYVVREINPFGYGNLSIGKFGKGFARKTDINPYREREIYEEFVGEKSMKHAPVRHDHLAAHNTRHGNVINPQQMPSPWMPKGKRRLRPPDMNKLNRQRQLNGPGRFHCASPVGANEARQQEALNRQVQSSSIIGVGRADLPSIGVWDNFIGSNLTEAQSKDMGKTQGLGRPSSRAGGGIVSEPVLQQQDSLEPTQSPTGQERQRFGDPQQHGGPISPPPPPQQATPTYQQQQQFTYQQQGTPVYQQQQPHYQQQSSPVTQQQQQQQQPAQHQYTPTFQQQAMQ